MRETEERVSKELYPKKVQKVDHRYGRGDKGKSEGEI
jgi:hypothetical protein